MKSAAAIPAAALLVLVPAIAGAADEGPPAPGTDQPIADTVIIEVGRYPATTSDPHVERVIWLT